MWVGYVRVHFNKMLSPYRCGLIECIRTGSSDAPVNANREVCTFFFSSLSLFCELIQIAKSLINSIKKNYAMKKFVFSLLMSLILTSVCNAQEVTSVLGLDFGTSREKAIAYLRERYGWDYDVSGGLVRFRNIDLGNQNYEQADFFFRDGKFVAAQFGKVYSISNLNAAKNTRESIYKEFSRKYTNSKDYIEEDGFKSYYLGNSMYYDRKYPIWISLHKGESWETRYGQKVNVKSVYVTSVSYYLYTYYNNDDI